MRPCTLVIAIAVAALAPAVAVAEAPLSATGTDRGIAVAVGGLSRSYEIGGVDVSGRGGVGGLHAYWQWGAALRAEGRLLAGSVDYDSPAPGDSSSVVLAEARATIGRATEREARLYTGVGVRRLAGDSPFGSGDMSSSLAYMPFGVAGAGRLRPGWRALVTIEGQFLLAGREEIDDIAGIGDGSFDRAGGWGAAVSAQFRNAAAGIGIEPFIRYLQPADTERERIGSSRVRISNAEEGSAGVRFIWAF